MPTVDVLDSTMHYRDTGSGTPIVLLHGNPGSSHVWRNVMPGLGGVRLLAPDLIGMGGSGKPALDYTFADHARYLDAWFDALGLDRVILVGHDWGGTLALDWAARHPERVLGIAFLEAIIKPLTWEELSPNAQQRSRTVRSPEAEETLLGTDALVRTAFTGGGVRTPVSDDDLAAYLAPYPDRESRRPLLAWARQIPLDGEPVELVTRMREFGTWMATSPDVPKLLLTFDGGAGSLLIDATMTAWCRSHIAALDVTPCGPAAHHAPEDRPTEIAAAITTWIGRHELMS